MSDELSWSEAANEIDDDLPVVASNNTCKPEVQPRTSGTLSSNYAKSSPIDNVVHAPIPSETHPSKVNQDPGISPAYQNKQLPRKGLKERLLNALLFAFSFSFIGALAYAWIIIPIFIAAMTFISPEGLDTETTVNTMIPMAIICAAIGALVGLLDIDIRKQANGLITVLAIGFGAAIGGVVLMLVVGAITGGNCPDAIAATTMLAGAFAGGYLGLRIVRK